MPDARRLAVLATAVVAFLCVALPALAQATTVLFGTIRPPGEDADVAGITITVSQDGQEVGSATTNEQGNWEVEVPGGGTYVVAIDPETIPEGLQVREERFLEQEIQAEEGRRRAVLFPVVAGDGGGVGPVRFEDLKDFLNLFVEGIKFGAIIAITAVGLSLIFGVTGLVNFAHGEMVTLGAVTALFLNGGFRVPWPLAIVVGIVVGLATGMQLGPRIFRKGPTSAQWGGSLLGAVLFGAITAAVLGVGFSMHLIPAAIIAIVIGGAIGFGMEASVFGPLRKRGTGLIAMLVISIGLSILLRYGILVVIAGQGYPYRDYTISDRLLLGPIETTNKDLAVTLLSLVVLAAIGLLLTRTRLGTAMRAVADNRDLAESSGIDVRRVILAVWIGGGMLAALGGVLQGMLQAVQFNMGFAMLLLMFAGVILGGLGTAFGAMVGGLVVGIVTQVSTFWFTVDLKLVFAFGVLILVLLVRPQGILGRKERIG